MPKARPAEKPPEDQQAGLSPQDFALLRAEAIADRTHPLYAVFTLENAMGSLEAVIRRMYETQPDEYDLEWIRNGVLSVAGSMQAVSLWTALMNKEPDRLKVGP